ncbi:MAG TPA: hypothetical protein DD381_02175 [Lentisphaeria bacterium]|nr:MAG: hypothetical protein A2X47_08860 [Lentisphaerae bacterium GWF2_38_69]HBM15143.1 hypothetical protein [Lentisphaeria bacterium]
MNIESDNFFDAIIIGAGPAGTAAAITLGHNLNFKLLIVDKENSPIDKVSGDALTGDSIRCLTELGIMEQVRKKGHMMSHIDLYPFNNKTHFSLDSEVITLQRGELSSILNRKVMTNANCQFRQLLFNGEIREEENKYQVDFLEPFTNKILTFTCSYVVISIGCQNDKCLYTLRNIPFKQPDAVAYRGYYSAKWDITFPRAIFFSLTRKGYIWVFPMKDGFYNVGCGFECTSPKTDLKKVLLNHIEKLNKEFGTEGAWEEAPKGAFLRSGLINYSKMSYGNVLFVGETISSTYPFTGQGVGKALETGIRAGSSILESFRLGHISSSELYNKTITEKIKPYFKSYNTAKSLFTNRLISPLAFSVIIRNLRLQKYISNILSEKSLPHDFSISKKIIDLLKKKKGR